LNKSDLKSKMLEVINNRSTEIIRLGDEIYRNPETGFKEFNTSRLVIEKFKEMQISYTDFGNIPGIKATLDTGRKGPEIAILGELDAVICTEHPHSDKATGAIHACGHNLQICAMIGAAMAIKDSGMLGELSGKVHFIAVPAEEYIEIAYRSNLREKGIIKYLCGKPELLYRGAFDNVDISIMTHSFTSNMKFALEPSCNGCLVKKVKYIGKAAHAGDTPEEGINALYAANIGLMAINSIRETFREDEYIRVHPIITKGGDIVNVIPSEVTIETFVRGKTMNDIMKANKKVNRALLSGAIALGAQIEIEDIPGYFPLVNDKNLYCIAEDIMAELSGKDEIVTLEHGKGSTDLGDLSTLMPVLHPYIGGIKGGLHSADYEVIDKDTAYLQGARLLSFMAAELLWGDGSTASNIIGQFVPLFDSKEEYFKFADKVNSKKLLPEQDFFV